MNGLEVMTYAEPDWGAKTRGTVLIRKDDRGNYTVNDVGVTAVQQNDLFTVLTCATGTIYYVFTAFFRTVGRDPIVREFA